MDWRHNLLPEIIEKLTRHLSRPIIEECEVVYLMVGVRKMMYHQNSARQYPVVRLFCDWTVHTSISRNPEAEPLLREFDRAAATVKAGNGFRLPFLLDVLSLSNFRSELGKFLDSNLLPTQVVRDQDEWDRFLDLYSSVVADCPITYTKLQVPFAHITNLTLTKSLPEDSYVLSLREQPFRVWMNWRVEFNDGSVENWPFYN